MGERVPPNSDDPNRWPFLQRSVAKAVTGAVPAAAATAQPAPSDRLAAPPNLGSVGV